jgi:cation transporter-like permease
MAQTSGNPFIFFLFSISNIVLIALGLLIAALTAWAMIKTGFDPIQAGACGGGVFSVITGIVAFCGRRNSCVINLFIFLLILVLIGYIVITVFGFKNGVCTYVKEDNERTICQSYEEIVKYSLLGVDVLIVSHL